MEHDSTDTLSSSPTSVSDLPTFFLTDPSPTRGGNVNKTSTTTITSLSDLVDALPEALDQRKIHDIAPGAPNDPISGLFRSLHLDRHDWHDYAFFDPSRPYTRNLIATDHQTYTLLLLCWNPGQESPIHDHPCDGCWLRVLQGMVRECRYDDHLHCTFDGTFHQDENAYITDSMGYHKVGNPTLHPSVTLHLYSPPIQQCRVWCNPDDYRSCTTSLSCHYSEYGEKVVAGATSTVLPASQK